MASSWTVSSDKEKATFRHPDNECYYMLTFNEAPDRMYFALQQMHTGSDDELGQVFVPKTGWKSGWNQHSDTSQSVEYFLGSDRAHMKCKLQYLQGDYLLLTEKQMSTGISVNDIDVHPDLLPLLTMTMMEHGLNQPFYLVTSTLLDHSGEILPLDQTLLRARR